MSAIAILYVAETDRYHAALFNESPFPGPIEQQADLVRLKSRLHHTEGAPTLTEARQHAEMMQEQFGVPDDDMLIDGVVDWSGWEQEGGIVLVFPDWRKFA